MHGHLTAAAAFCAVLSAAAAARAPQPAPSAAQAVALQHDFTIFMHYGLCTYVGCQWDIPPADPNLFQPTGLDTDNWMRTALAAGATQVCLTVRHVDGFHLWPTTTSDYSVKASSWRNGTGDVVAEFVASARKLGISPCFYIILGFNVHANKTGVPGPAYLQQQVTALTELLTQYGHIDRLWWDNFALDGSRYQPVTHEGFVCPGNVLNATTCPAWQVLIDTVRAVSPGTAMVPGADGCLVNAESAGGTYPVYHATHTPNGSYWCSGEATRFAAGPTFTMVESDYSILNPGDNWFWAAGDPHMNASEIAAQVAIKHDAGATLIFNVPPNSTGVVPDEYVAALAAFAEARAATLAAPAALLPAPVTASCADLSITLPVSGPFDMLVAAEGLAAGQAIGGYSVEVQMAAGGPWAPLPVHGVTVGSRVTDVLPTPVAGAHALRFNCTSDLTPPPPSRVVNAAGGCMAIPAGQAFPCWSDANFALCPLVAVPAGDCAAAGPAGVWELTQGGPWLSAATTPSSTPAINIDCNGCAVGTHAKLIDCGAGCQTALTLVGDRIRIDACPGMCLTNGTAPGALPSCAGSEPWSPPQIHADACAADSTAGWSIVPVAAEAGAAAAPQVTLAAFGAYLQRLPAATSAAAEAGAA